jgi:hypothetical protein
MATELKVTHNARGSFLQQETSPEDVLLVKTFPARHRCLVRVPPDSMRAEEILEYQPTAVGGSFRSSLQRNSLKIVFEIVEVVPCGL